jgi:hypothetical protein
VAVSHASLACSLLAACEMSPKRPPLESTQVILDLNREELTQPFAKAFGDVNGDTLPDIVIGEMGGPVFAYLYPGWERVTLHGSNGGDDVVVADFNGDGRMDIASNGQRVAWYENAGDLSQGMNEHVLMYGRRTHDLAAHDMDGDGRMDLITRDEHNNLSFLLLQEEGGSWTEVQLAHALGGVGTCAADMDGDGRLDILGSGYYLRQGDDPRSPGDWARVMVAEWPIASAVRGTDMDGDGHTDLVLAAAYDEHRLSWFRNPGPRDPADTSYWEEKIIAQGVSHVHRFHLHDVDGNGALDILFAEQHQSRRHRVGVMLNNDGRGGSWTMKLFDDKGGHNIAIADVGNDGNLEILAVNWNGDTRIRLLTDLLKDSNRKSISPRILSLRKPPMPAGRPVAVAGSGLDDLDGLE